MAGPTLSEWPVAEARTLPLLQSHTHIVFLASRPMDTSRCGTKRQTAGGQNLGSALLHNKH